jgi:hypothetical protein
MISKAITVLRYNGACPPRPDARARARASWAWVRYVRYTVILLSYVTNISISINSFIHRKTHNGYITVKVQPLCL